MITGDYPATAQAIARQAGLQVGETVTGETLDRLSEAELAERFASDSVRPDYARAEASDRQCA